MDDSTLARLQHENMTVAIALAGWSAGACSARVDLDRTSAPSCPKGGGGGRQFLVGGLGHVVGPVAVLG